MAKRDVRWYVWLPALATLISVPFSTAFYTWPDPIVAFWIAGIPGFLGAYYLGPTFALAQGLVGLRMRALAASILLFILNLIGMGLGPVIVGATSDLLNAYTGLGVQSVRWALVSVLLFNVMSTVFYLMAAKDSAFGPRAQPRIELNVRLPNHGLRLALGRRLVDGFCEQGGGCHRRRQRNRARDRQTAGCARRPPRAGRHAGLGVGPGRARGRSRR